jgi:hypothetical protein
MRAALELGRWTFPAPLGYLNAPADQAGAQYFVARMRALDRHRLPAHRGTGVMAEGNRRCHRRGEKP